MHINWLELLKEFKYIILVIILIIIVSILSINEFSKPDDMTKRLADGEVLVEKKQTLQAIIHYSKFVRDYPRNYFGHISLGDLYLKTGNIEKSKIEYLRAIELANNRRFDGYFKIAKIYLDLMKDEIALKVLHPLEKNNQKEVLVNFGDFYFYWGKRYSYTLPEESIRKYKVGLEYYNKSLDHDKIYEGQDIIAKTYADLADSLLHEGKIQEAEDLLNVSLEQFENAPAYVVLGRIYRNKDIDNAVEYYDKAYNLKHDSISKEEYCSALISMAEFLEEMGKSRLAKLYIEKAEKISEVTKKAEKTKTIKLKEINSEKNSHHTAAKH